MSRKIENGDLQRYNNPVIVNHLASNYVLGQLTPRVRKRVDNLRNDFDFKSIEQQINYWEQKLAPLHTHTPTLDPLPETWTNIQARLNMGQPVKSRFFSWQSLSMWRLSGALSFVFCVVLSLGLLQPSNLSTELSYIAVLEDESKTPQVVASAYSGSKQLVLDILSLPEIDSEESFELWVTSKTDNQTRSLGEIPKGTNSFNRELSIAEWRLITDSSYLIITVEDTGGSPIGEPSESIVSRGLCIQLEGRGNAASA